MAESSPADVVELPNPDIGGYKVLLVSVIPKKYKCPLCNLLMRDALQTYRGEMACESCYQHAKGNTDICPLDNEAIGEEEVFKDMHARRAILQLPCYCSNKLNECTWEGTVNDIQDHSTDCLYKEISCTECHDIIVRKDVEEHVKEFCRFRSVQCQYCQRMFNAQSLQEHQQTCTSRPLDCPYQCGQNVTLNNLYDHVQACSKVNEGSICPYQIVGCKHEPESVSDLTNHLHSTTTHHVAFTAALFVTLLQSNEKTRQDLLSEQTLRAELAQKVEHLSKEKSMMATEIKKVEDQLYNVQKECATLQEKCDATVTKVEEDLQTMEVHTENDEVKEVDEKLNELNLKFEELETKIKTGLPESSSVISSLVSEEVKDAIGRVDQLESGSAIISANLSDLELKLQLLENTCYEGRQIWKVDNVAYRMNQAVTGKVTALHSAPCFEKRGGYKFCSRLYLNGDGMGRGTHTSLFFVVMKSEYDALLQWPFSERVTFRLINPYNRDDTIQESFLPDKNSSSFKRPTKDMNIAAGCPMFIRKEKLQQFIVDDVLFIETSITSDTG